MSFVEHKLLFSWWTLTDRRPTNSLMELLFPELKTHYRLMLDSRWLGWLDSHQQTLRRQIMENWTGLEPMSQAEDFHLQTLYASYCTINSQSAAATISPHPNKSKLDLTIEMFFCHGFLKNFSRRSCMYFSTSYRTIQCVWDKIKQDSFWQFV